MNGFRYQGPDIKHSPEATLQATQLIALALIAGVTAMSGLIIFVMFNGAEREPTTNDLASKVCAAIGVAALLAIGVMSRTRVRSDIPEEKLPAAWQTRMVIRFAMLEGTALLLAIAYFIEIKWWIFALLITNIVLMALLFPTRVRFDRFMDRNVRR